MSDRICVSFDLARGVRSNLERLKTAIGAVNDAELVRRALAVFQDLTQRQQDDSCTFELRFGGDAPAAFSLRPEVVHGVAGDSPPERVRFDVSQEALHALNKLKQVHAFDLRAEVVRAALNVLDRLVAARRAEKVFVVIAPQSEPTTISWDELIR